MTILVTGALGQVGFELQRALAPLAEVTAVDVADCNLADAHALRALVRRVQPVLIVNPAAYTAVDKAESDRELAYAVNAAAPRVLGEEAAALGIPVVHYSTDYVFDGHTPGARVETDEPAPLSAYGRTKLAGERAVAAAGGAHLIFRTAWVYGRRGGNFMLTMIRLMREREELRVVSDQHGTPTWCRLLADVPARIIAAHWADPERRAGLPSGLYHLTNAGETTWHEYALAIRDLAPELADRRHVRIHPITTAEYPLPAPRPAWSVLDNGRLERTFGIRAEHWREALSRCLAET